MPDRDPPDQIGQGARSARTGLRLIPGGAGHDQEVGGTESDSVERRATQPPRVTFADVGGLDALKEKIRLRVIHPLRRPDLFAAYGKRLSGGLLFYGPPGCGKTHLARATAGEAGIAFLSVGVDDVLDMWLGGSEKRLAEWFRRARAEAPCVLFFDEVDALGGRRGTVRQESYRTLVSQFLAELDGLSGPPNRSGPSGHSGQSKMTGNDAPGRDGAEVLVLAATNAPWDLDAAFRRPGRFGDVLFVPPPDLGERVEILKIALKDKPTDPALSLDLIARRTELCSGADLVHVVDAAVEQALSAAMRDGAVRPISTAALLDAATRVKPSTREWFHAAKNFVTYANEGGQYDEVAQFIARHRL